ncbi:hypothetical protein BG023_111704 [Porphyrobacter sp. LM 6]|nr:hypothetical protein BG023_111704 [Porphyrobacter sp. LM 6]
MHIVPESARLPQNYNWFGNILALTRSNIPS